METTIEQPAISVIIPVYNVESYLEQTIQSVLQQSFNDWELIVVDDASTDNSLAIAKSFAERDPRLHVIALEKNSPGGAGIPSNIGLRQAKGRYVAFLDSNDIYYPDYLEKLFKHAEIFDQVDIAMIGFHIHFLDKNKQQPCYPDASSWNYLLYPKLSRRHPKVNVRYVQMEQMRSCVRHRSNDHAWHPVLAFYLLFGLSPASWRKLYRRDFLEEHKIQFPEDKHFFEDVPLHWMVCSRANNILFCNSIAYQHHIGKKGQTTSPEPETQIAAKLFQAEQLLNYLLAAIEQQELGQDAEFYLLLWMRSLLHSFCYAMRFENLAQWQKFYWETLQMLQRRTKQSPLLAQILQPLHKLRLADLYHLRFNLLAAISWHFFVAGLDKEQPDDRSCDRWTKSFLILLRLPISQYARALRERLSYYISRFH